MVQHVGRRQIQFLRNIRWNFASSQEHLQAARGGDPSLNTSGLAGERGAGILIFGCLDSIRRKELLYIGEIETMVHFRNTSKERPSREGRALTHGRQLTMECRQPA